MAFHSILEKKLFQNVFLQLVIGVPSSLCCLWKILRESSGFPSWPRSPYMIVLYAVQHRWKKGRKRCLTARQANEKWDIGESEQCVRDLPVRGEKNPKQNTEGIRKRGRKRKNASKTEKERVRTQSTLPLGVWKVHVFLENRQLFREGSAENGCPKT